MLSLKSKDPGPCGPDFVHHWVVIRVITFITSAQVIRRKADRRPKKRSVKSKKKLCRFILAIIGCGSGFQPLSSDDSYLYSDQATFFRGWKPLPQAIDANLMTLNFRKLHTGFREQNSTR
jgi:hypothetical protein